MSDVSLVTEPRRVTGSAACRRLRNAGKVPAVLYGPGLDPVSLVVDSRVLRDALSGPSGLNALLTLDIAGTRHLALARQVQRGPLRGGIDHVDFLVVDPDATIGADVPIRLEGEAVELHRSDGIVEQQLFSLPVIAKPGDIPTHIEVDITDLLVGDTYRVGDLRLPAGVEADLDPGEPVVSGVATRAELLEEEEEAAAAEAEEAAAGEGAEAAAEGGDQGQGEQAPEG